MIFHFSKDQRKRNIKIMSKECPPQRYILGLMGFFAIANSYAMRSCLNIAITEMVSNKIVTATVNTSLVSSVCPGELKEDLVNQKYEFDWNETTQGLILSAFYWGYVLTHIPGGLLAEKFGGKQTLGMGILSTSILTIFTPLAARAGSKYMIISRFLVGLSEGTTFPALNTMLAQWVPPMERGKLGSLVFAGNQIGTVFSTIVSGLILKYGNKSWPSVFYLFGSLGIIWYVIFHFTCYSDPASHPFITEKEKDYLINTLGSICRNKSLGPTPWFAMAKSLPLWGLIIGQLGHDWGLFTIQTDLPKYMKSVMKFSIAENGFLSALPFLVMWLTAIFAGWLSDYLLAKNIWKIAIARKVFTTIASLGPAIGIISASYAGCDQTAVALFFTLGMAFMGFFYPSLKVNPLDLSPNYAGTLMAIVNGLGAIAGIITPILVGILTPNQTLLEWRIVFWISFVVIIVTNLIYVVIGSGDVQSWNNSKEIKRQGNNNIIKNNSKELLEAETTAV